METYKHFSYSFFFCCDIEVELFLSPKRKVEFCERRLKPCGVCLSSR